MSIHKPLLTIPLSQGCLLVASLMALATTSMAVPVPGYVPPTTQTTAPTYVDDTRGVYVPAHAQQRLKTDLELQNWQQTNQDPKPLYAGGVGGQRYEAALNTVATGAADTGAELERIAKDPGLLSGGKMSSDAMAESGGEHVNYAPVTGGLADGTMLSQAAKTPSLSDYPSLATGGLAKAAPAAAPKAAASYAPIRTGDGGEEVAVGRQAPARTLDMQNGVVRLKEERIAVRRVLQRMLDQIGGGQWTVVWDLDEQNAGLPDMEISIAAEEPFMNVMNSLLARLQTRSGQPLRVIKYDKTQRLVITDRTGGETRATAGVGGTTSSGKDVAVTEAVLKEAVVSLHYDEVPLVDALENVVNQAGKGQWRLRMYAGTDQVLKPAHIEEPFGVAVERILKVFGLRYEIFPGGKLIVVTGTDNFGFRGVQ